MWKMSRATKSALQHCCAKSHGSKSREETEINAETRMELGNESCKRRKRRRREMILFPRLSSNRTFYDFIRFVKLVETKRNVHKTV